MWEKEKELIRKYDTTNPAKGYNLSIGGEKSGAGYHPTEEHKRKLSAALKGKKRPPFTEKHRKRLSESKKGEKNPNYKKICPESIRQKISESMKGKNTGPHPKLKWITPSGEIKYMDIQNARKLHPDWKEVKDD